MGVPHTVDQPPDATREPEGTLDQVLNRLAKLALGEHGDALGTASVEDSVRRIETRIEDPIVKMK